MLKLNNLFNNPGSKNKYKRLGRGIGSGKGKTCGRGGKGQTARSGVALKWFEGGQTPLIRRLPKRGFVGKKANERPDIVNLSKILEFFDGVEMNGINIDNQFLFSKGLIRNSATLVKLLANIEELRPLKGVTFKLAYYSAAAREIILSAGGEIL